MDSQQPQSMDMECLKVSKEGGALAEVDRNIELDGTREQGLDQQSTTERCVLYIFFNSGWRETNVFLFW